MAASAHAESTANVTGIDLTGIKVLLSSYNSDKKVDDFLRALDGYGLQLVQDNKNIDEELCTQQNKQKRKTENTQSARSNVNTIKAILEEIISKLGIDYIPKYSKLLKEALFVKQNQPGAAKFYYQHSTLNQKLLDIKSRMIENPDNIKLIAQGYADEIFTLCFDYQFPATKRKSNSYENFAGKPFADKEQSLKDKVGKNKRQRLAELGGAAAAPPLPIPLEAQSEAEKKLEIAAALMTLSMFNANNTATTENQPKLS